MDGQGRTALPHVYAIGDITEGPALAHKAMAEGVVAAEAISGLPTPSTRRCRSSRSPTLKSLPWG